MALRRVYEVATLFSLSRIAVAPRRVTNDDFVVENKAGHLIGAIERSWIKDTLQAEVLSGNLYILDRATHVKYSERVGCRYRITQQGKECYEHLIEAIEMHIQAVGVNYRPKRFKRAKDLPDLLTRLLEPVDAESNEYQLLLSAVQRQEWSTPVKKLVNLIVFNQGTEQCARELDEVRQQLASVRDDLCHARDVTEEYRDVFKEIKSLQDRSRLPQGILDKIDLLLS
ncbi:hypothetical protein K474DRAFT_1703169 [Panus rudis PR-1116 ss-1]|nr:hypothetical protein K474DRAFT_1703169 [Panus rudis PR-1116 ss-1]